MDVIRWRNNNNINNNNNDTLVSLLFQKFHLRCNHHIYPIQQSVTIITIIINKAWILRESSKKWTGPTGSRSSEESSSDLLTPGDVKTFQVVSCEQVAGCCDDYLRPLLLIDERGREHLRRNIGNDRDGDGDEREHKE